MATKNWKVLVTKLLIRMQNIRNRAFSKTADQEALHKILPLDWGDLLAGLQTIFQERRKQKVQQHQQAWPWSRFWSHLAEWFLSYIFQTVHSTLALVSLPVSPPLSFSISSFCPSLPSLFRKNLSVSPICSGRDDITAFSTRCWWPSTTMALGLGFGGWAFGS